MTDRPLPSDLEYLNSIAVTPADVIHFNEEANLVGSPGRRHSGLPVRKYHDNDELATALLVRLDAFHELFHHGLLRPWAEPADDNGVTALHPAVFAAIASEPLIEENGIYLFNAATFSEAVLAHASTEGSA